MIKIQKANTPVPEEGLGCLFPHPQHGFSISPVPTKVVQSWANGGRGHGWGHAPALPVAEGLQAPTAITAW